MATEIKLKSWLRFTIFNGLAAAISYVTAFFAPLPEKIALLLAFAFGPFFLLASLGLYYLIRFWKKSIALITGTLFNIIGTTLVTLMLIVQQTSFAFHNQFKTENRGTVTDEQLKWIFREVNSVQLGIDLAWDLFISAGTIFIALSIWNHPVYRKIFSITGILVSALLLSFNMASFPVPPDAAGSIDFGPLVAIWYSTLTLFTWAKWKKFSEDY
jgi:hypothetical protein